MGHRFDFIAIETPWKSTSHKAQLSLVSVIALFVSVGLMKVVRDALLVASAPAPAWRAYAAGTQAAILLLLLPVLRPGSGLARALVRSANIVLLTFALLLALGERSPALAFFFFVWSGLFSLVAGAEIWHAYATRMLAIRFVPLAMWVAAAASMLLMHMHASLLVLALLSFVFATLHSLFRTESKEEESDASPPSTPSAARSTRDTHFVLLMFAFAIFSGLADVVLAVHAKAAGAGEGPLIRFYADYGLLTHTIALVLTHLLLRRASSPWLGVGLTLHALFGMLVVFGIPLIGLLWLRASSAGLDYANMTALRNRAPEQRTRYWYAAETLAVRLGDLMVAAIVLAYGTL